MAKWDHFWTGCFLRLAHCHLNAPALLKGSGSILELEAEAMKQILRTCCAVYGDGVLLGTSAGAGTVVHAMGRVMERL